MKRIVIALVCLSIIFPVFSQTDVKTDNLRKWEIGAFISPSLAKLKRWQYPEIYNDFEFVLSGGAKAEYRFSKRFSVQTGVEYFRNKVENERVGLSGMGDGSGESIYYYTVRGNYLEVPLNIKMYLLKDKKCQPYVAVGITNQFTFIKEYNICTFNGIVTDEFKYQQNDYNIAHLSFSAGVNIKCDDRLSINIEPTLKYDMRKNTDFRYSISSEYDYYRIGLVTGVKYAF